MKQESATTPGEALSPWLGRSIERFEDAALLSGRGQYADDLGGKPGMLHAAVVRSPHAHAIVKAIDVAAARAAGGVSIIPHPADSPKMTELELRAADGIEVFNSTCTRRSNARAAEMAQRLSKPSFASSDAHLVVEIGNGRTRVEDCGTLEELRRNLLKQPVVSRTENSNPLLHRLNEAYNFATRSIWKKL